MGSFGFRSTEESWKGATCADRQMLLDSCSGWLDKVGIAST